MLNKKRTARIGSLLCTLCVLFSVLGVSSAALDAGETEPPAPAAAAREETTSDGEAVPAEADESEPGDASPAAETDSAAKPDEPEASETGAVLQKAGGGAAEKTSITVAEFEFQRESEGTQTTIKLDQWYRMKLAWDASAYGNTLQAGDYFVVTLPDELRYATNAAATRFDILAPDGSVVAKAVVDPNDGAGGGTVTVTFTGYVKNRYNIKGTMFLNAQAVTERVRVNSSNPIRITVGRTTETTDVYVGAGTPARPVHPNQVLTKWASTGGSTEEAVLWAARINFAKETLEDVVITDMLHTEDGNLDGLRYDPERFCLYEREFDAYGHTVRTVQTWDSAALGDRLQFNADHTGFTLAMGDIDGRQYLLLYYSSYAPGIRLRSSMTLTAGADEWNVCGSYAGPASGGTGLGVLNNQIQIRKVDADDPQLKLPGAVFRITSGVDGSVRELTTDENGEAVSEQLPAGEYVISELAAPPGYRLDPMEYTVTVSDGETVVRTLTNQAERISIPVEKKWAGPAQGAVTVRLLRDGLEAGETLILSDENGWTGSFADLRRTAPDGTAYVYTVLEVPVEGYTAAIAGDMEQGFTITNTKQDEPSPPRDPTEPGEPEKPGAPNPPAKPEKPAMGAPPSTPKTADESDLITPLALLLLSGCALTWLPVMTRRKSDRLPAAQDSEAARR